MKASWRYRINGCFHGSADQYSELLWYSCHDGWKLLAIAQKSDFALSLWCTKSSSWFHLIQTSLFLRLHFLVEALRLIFLVLLLIRTKAVGYFEDYRSWYKKYCGMNRVKCLGYGQNRYVKLRSHYQDQSFLKYGFHLARSRLVPVHVKHGRYAR